MSAEFIGSGGWAIFFCAACCCLPAITCCIVLCICVRMPGCLLHNQDIVMRSSDGRIQPKSTNRLFNTRSETSQPSNRDSPLNVSTPLSYPEAPRVIIYKPTVPNPNPTRPTLRDLAEATKIVNRTRRPDSPTAPLDEYEPPPPYNEAVTDPPS